MNKSFMLAELAAVDVIAGAPVTPVVSRAMMALYAIYFSSIPYVYYATVSLLVCVVEAVNAICLCLSSSRVVFRRFSLRLYYASHRHTAVTRVSRGAERASLECRNL